MDITNIIFIVSLSQTEIHMHILDLILDMIIVGDEEEDVKWREIRLPKMYCYGFSNVLLETRSFLNAHSPSLTLKHIKSIPGNELVPLYAFNYQHNCLWLIEVKLK